MRIIFMLLAKEHIGEKWYEVYHNYYDSCIAMSAYGDDHIVRVHGMFPWFNMITIQKKMAEFGIMYTHPDKGEITEPYILEKDLTYLKRYFAYRQVDGGRQHCFAVKPIEDIEEIVKWINRKGDRFALTIQCLDSAMYELAHHPKEVYERTCKKFQRACTEACIGWSYPPYEETVQMILHGKVSYAFL